jgi:serine/threonine protein kinase
MLSTENTSDAVVTQSEDEQPGVVGLTEAYASPELLKLAPRERKRIDPPLDMWALGIILHIMLVGCHPFDTTGDVSETKIAKLVAANSTPATLQEDSPLTEHLSESAVDLIKRLLEWDPKKRITASEMLEHPWVRGTTARKDKMSGSDKKLSKFRVFKSRLEAKVFEDIVSWADSDDNEDVAKRTSLIERSFRMLDAEQKGKLSIPS